MLAVLLDILAYQIFLKMIAMKIDTKIVLFEKIEALIILLFVTILVTSFILLLFFNIPQARALGCELREAGH